MYFVKDIFKWHFIVHTDPHYSDVIRYRLEKAVNDVKLGIKWGRSCMVYSLVKLFALQFIFNVQWILQISTELGLPLGSVSHYKVHDCNPALLFI